MQSTAIYLKLLGLWELSPDIVLYIVYFRYIQHIYKETNVQNSEFSDKWALDKRGLIVQNFQQFSRYISMF